MPASTVVVSELIPRKRYFYYVAWDNTYGMEIEQASQFKRFDVARAVCRTLDAERDTGRHLVVKITTRNNSIKTLRYFQDT